VFDINPKIDYSNIELFMRGEKMKVQNGNNVSVHYRGTLNDGTEFDNSKIRGQTLSFEVGSGRMLPGFDRAVVGMTVGQTKKISLAANEAYGPRIPDAIQAVPKTSFPPDFEFLVGEVIQGNGPQGPFLAKIEEEKEQEVVLDFNHPLAGEDLSFEIELVSFEDPAASSWNSKMKKAELLAIAKGAGLDVNTKSTKAQIIEALESN
tara:strand:- start:730 stop:1347 length:618 start_codon:yes stop_codon:yes gene_type:complete